MAPKFFSSVTILALILALFVTAIPTQVQAASSTRINAPTQSMIKEHVFKFYLDPALVTDINFTKAVLPKYVADMNFVLQKNTNRRLVFNPETDIILTSTQPYSNSATPPLPVEGFEIWAHAVKTNYPTSYGGYAGIDTSGAGVLAGFKWTRLYNPDQLKASNVSDYWTQINNMLHELAHVFGAGYGEYYRLSNIQDTTGISPLLNINVYEQNDSFWSDKPDFKADPLLWNPAQIGILGQSPNRETLLSFVQYSGLTAAIISGNYRNSVPTVDLSHIKIKIVDNDGLPLEAANVKIWSVIGSSPYQAQLMVDGFTDSDGNLTFAWGGSANPHNSYDFLRLIKVYKDGYLASAKYVSIYDADIEKLIGGSDVFNIAISLSKPSLLPLTGSGSTFMDVSSTHAFYRYIEAFSQAGITVGCSQSPKMYCPDKPVTRSEMAVFLLRAMHGSSFQPNPTQRGMFTDLSDPALAAFTPWIEQFYNEGITVGCSQSPLRYCPQNYVTRGEMAVFIERAVHGSSYHPNPAQTGMYTDLNYPGIEPFTPWIEQFYLDGITVGCSQSPLRYCPQNYVTRGEMAVFIDRAFKIPLP